MKKIIKKILISLGIITLMILISTVMEFFGMNPVSFHYFSLGAFIYLSVSQNIFFNE